MTLIQAKPWREPAPGEHGFRRHLFYTFQNGTIHDYAAWLFPQIDAWCVMKNRQRYGPRFSADEDRELDTWLLDRATAPAAAAP